MSHNLTRQPIRQIPINTKGTDYIIGDIHGQYSKLISKLTEINFDYSKDRLFSVGDFLDRGPENVECYYLLFEDWFFAVRGNHEDMLAYYNNKGSYYPYAEDNGQRWFIALQDKSLQKAISSDLDCLPYIIELQSPNGWIGIVHASPVGYNWFETTENIFKDSTMWNGYPYREQVIWDRSFYESCIFGKYKNKTIAGIDYVVTGHNHNPEPRISGNFYSIATISYDKNFEFKLLNTTTMEII